MTDLVTVVMGRVREAESVRPRELRCSRCREWKPDHEYSLDPSCTIRRGRRYWCRRCLAAKRSAARAARRAKLHAGNIPPKPPRVTGSDLPRTRTQEQLRAFWLERFDMAEIREMAAALEQTPSKGTR